MALHLSYTIDKDSGFEDSDERDGATLYTTGFDLTLHIEDPDAADAFAARIIATAAELREKEVEWERKRAENRRAAAARDRVTT
jgi:hypothetical protein